MGSNFNPWLSVPTEPPYVPACDSEFVHAYNRNCRNDVYQMQLNVLPEPFMGVKTAPVVLLTLNPGFEDRNIEEHRNLDFQTAVRDNYGHALSVFPFYYLNPQFSGGGLEWCKKKLKRLLDEFGNKRLARSIFYVDYFPYHSRRCPRTLPKLPSQNYGLGLVREAIARGAVIVIMRARKRWIDAIPELETYSKQFSLNSPQNVVVSPGNCVGFDAIVSAVRGGDANV